MAQITSNFRFGTRSITSIQQSIRAAALITTIGVLFLPNMARAGAITLVTDPNGATDTPPFIQLLGVNDSGTIVGYTGIGMTLGGGSVLDPNRGLILNLPNAFTNLNPNFNPATCNICQTQVFGITDAGTTTAGFYISPAGVTHGFVDVGNGPTATSVVDPLTPTGSTNQLLGLNHTGTEAAGFFTDILGNDDPYVYNVMTQTFTALPFLANGPGAGDSSQATGVNNAGMVTGFDATTGTGFLYNPLTNSYAAIDAPNAMFTQPLGLNDLGQVVGTYDDMAGVAHGFLYSGGSFLTIDPTGSTATALNGINDGGEIVGFYTDANNDTIGVVITPEPSAFLLAGAGLAALLKRFRRIP